MIAPPELHPNLVELDILVGEWKGEGSGSYPTIESFEYLETSEWSHVGKPFLAYRQATTSLQGDPLHSELGYWRVPGPSILEVVIAQPFGAVEISSGTVRSERGTVVVEMATTLVSTTPSAKQVTEVSRRYEVSGDVLTYHVAMAAVGEDLSGHLDATLRRA